MRFQISEDKKKFIFPDGKTKYIMGTGDNGYIPKNLSKWKKAGLNYITKFIIPHGEKSPYNRGKGESIDNNWNGFNDKWWNDLDGQVKDCERNGIAVSFIVFATTMRKNGKGTWSGHLWNELNGGVLSATKNGITPFYNLSSRAKGNTSLFGKFKYSELKNNSEKSTYRQEQLLHEVARKFNKYNNTSIVLSWELHAFISIPWAVHMVKFIDSMTCDNYPIGVGTWEKEHVLEIMKKSNVQLFSFQEAASISKPMKGDKLVHDLIDVENYPTATNGCQLYLEARYRAKKEKKKEKCKFFKKGMEDSNIEEMKKFVAESILKGGASINTCFPFWWLNIPTRYITKDCGESDDIIGYDKKYIEKKMFDFYKKLQRLLSKIDIKDEPGIKINRDFFENNFGIKLNNTNKDDEKDNKDKKEIEHEGNEIKDIVGVANTEKGNCLIKEFFNKNKKLIFASIFVLFSLILLFIVF